MKTTLASRHTGLHTISTTPSRRAGLAGLLVLLAAGAPVRATTDAPAPQRAAVPNSVERLAWMAGCWAGTLSNGALYEESWLAPRAGQMLGVSRMTRDGRTLSFEFIRIAEVDGTLMYFAQPSGRPPTEFRAVRLEDSAVTFENAAHDFPQRILYRSAAPDTLAARIEGERDGQTRGLDFPLRRAECPSGAA